MADERTTTSQLKPTAPGSPRRPGKWAEGATGLLRRWVEPLSLFFGWRLGLGLLAVWAGALLAPIARNGTAPYSPVNLGEWGDRLLGVWTRWDGEWFLYVAQVGYRPGEATTPFFPLYPVLLRVGATLLGGNYVLAGVLLSAAISLILFVLLYELVSFDFGKSLAERTTLYLAVFPTSFFLTACYSEGLFLALTLGAFLAARRYANWWVAGLLIGLAALTRNIGILLLLPLGWEWWRQFQGQEANVKLGRWRFDLRWREWQPLGTLAFIGLPLLLLGSWLVYNGIALGDPLNFISVQSNPVWNRRSAWPWETLGRAFELFWRDRPASSRDDPNQLDLVFWLFSAALFVASCYQCWRKQLPFAYLLYFAITLLLPLFSPAGKEPLLSFPRFALLGFPAFVVLACYGARWKVLHYTYLLSAALLLGLLLARFANWYWVA